MSVALLYDLTSWALLALCLSATLANIVLLVVLIATSLLHSNVCWLLGNTSLASIVACIHVLVRSAVHLQGQTNTLIDAQLCMAEEIPFTAALFVLVLSMLTIGVERLWASAKKGEIDSSGFLGLALSMALWSVAVMLCTLMLLMAKRLNPVDFCVALFVQSPVVFYIVNSLIAVTDVCCLFLFLALHRRNSNSLYHFGINLATTQNLAARFQIRRNIYTTRMLIPAMLIHLTCYGFVAAFGFLTFPKRKELGVEKALYINGMYLFLVVQCALHPLVAFVTCRSLRHTLSRLLRSVTDRSSPQHSSHVVQFHRTPEEYSLLITSTWRHVGRQESSNNFRRLF